MSVPKVARAAAWLTLAVLALFTSLGAALAILAAAR
jgi:hypothetical protein